MLNDFLFLVSPTVEGKERYPKLLCAMWEALSFTLFLLCSPYFYLRQRRLPEEIEILATYPPPEKKAQIEAIQQRYKCKIIGGALKGRGLELSVRPSIIKREKAPEITLHEFGELINPRVSIGSEHESVALFKEVALHRIKTLDGIQIALKAKKLSTISSVNYEVVTFKCGLQDSAVNEEGKRCA
jgi:hypothetical protein